MLAPEKIKRDFICRSYYFSLVIVEESVLDETPIVNNRGRARALVFGLMNYRAEEADFPRLAETRISERCELLFFFFRESAARVR